MMVAQFLEFPELRVLKGRTCDLDSVQSSAVLSQRLDLLLQIFFLPLIQK